MFKIAVFKIYKIGLNKLLFKKKKSAINAEILKMVHLAGIEPARPCGQQILSLQRLPVPPQVPDTNVLYKENIINAI